MSRTAPISHRPRPASAWLWACLLAALLLAPWLGSVHAVLHARAPQATGAMESAAPVASAPGLAAPLPAGRDLKRLFGDHGHANDCRLYDQLSHSDALLTGAALPPLLLPPPATLLWFAGECLRRWATLFDARGPPALA